MITVCAMVGPATTHIDVTGHEDGNYGEAGRVCSAVSAITQTALLGLQEIARLHPQLVEFTISAEPR